MPSRIAMIEITGRSSMRVNALAPVGQALKTLRRLLQVSTGSNCVENTLESAIVMVNFIGTDGNE